MSLFRNRPWDDATEASLFDREYLPYIKDYPQLMKIYKKGNRFRFANLSSVDLIKIWSHLFPLRGRNEEGLPFVRTVSRQEAERLVSKKNQKDPHGEYVSFRYSEKHHTVYNGLILRFLYDIAYPMLARIVEASVVYYGDAMPKSGQKLQNAIIYSLLLALTVFPVKSRLAYLRRGGYETNRQIPFFLTVFFDTFWIDVLERFKALFWRSAGSPRAAFSDNDVEFIGQFEHEWERAKLFSGLNYDFVVVSAFEQADMVRYSQLSESYRISRRIVNEMIDYVVLRICPRLLLELDQIEEKRFQSWQHVLIEMTGPLVNGILRSIERAEEKGRNSRDRMQLRETLEKRIVQLATSEYNYRFRKNEALERTPGIWSIFPLGHLVELSIFAQDLTDGRLSHILAPALNSMMQKLKWVRPSHFLKQKLFRVYAPKRYFDRSKKEKILFDEHSKSKREEAKKYEIPTDKDENYEQPAPETIPYNKEFYNYLEKKLKGEAGACEDELLARAPEALQSQEIYRDPETNKDFYLVGGVANKLGLSGRTVRRWAIEGEIPFVWKKLQSAQGKKSTRCRTFPKEEIDRLQAVVSQKRIAETIGVTDRQWRRIKKRYGLDRSSTKSKGLSKLERRKQLLNLAKDWEERRRGNK